MSCLYLVTKDKRAAGENNAIGEKSIIYFPSTENNALMLNKKKNFIRALICTFNYDDRSFELAKAWED